MAGPLLSITAHDSHLKSTPENIHTTVEDSKDLIMVKQALVSMEAVEAESQTQKLMRKSKRDPFIPIGIVGLMGALGYGVYAYKNRGPAMTTSRYLMRLRVLAQSCVVGSIMVGVALASPHEKKDKH